MTTTLREHFPDLRPAQVRGLATWGYGALAAGHACETAVIATWLAEDPTADPNTLRQLLRDGLRDGPDKAAPCTTALAVADCFAPLLRWVLSEWTDQDRLVLAVDVTNRRDEVATIVVSVLYRGTALPVAWHSWSTAPKPKGAPRDDWAGKCGALLRALRPAIPPRMLVLVLADRGLRSPRLRKTIRRLGFRPLLRLDRTAAVRPVGQSDFVPAHTLVAEAGHAWAGRATLYTSAVAQFHGTLLVVWDLDQQEPWVLFTTLRPRQVGLVWYSLRMWIELGFRALKGVGFEWQHTRRTHPARIDRHWLVLAIAMRWTLVVGTRAEDAAHLGVDPARLHRPPTGVPVSTAPRWLSVFARGRALIRRQVLRGRLWQRGWLAPTPWPTILPRLQVHYHLLTAGP